MNDEYPMSGHSRRFGHLPITAPVVGSLVTTCGSQVGGV
jgi:hypothetical protein